MRRCKKLLSAMLALCLILGLLPCSALAEESQSGLENFTERNTYADGQFADVDEGSWYYENVKSVYELGLMTGKSTQRFDPDGNITIAETVTIAVRLHAAYHGSTFQADSAEPWYKPYVDYAVENGIIQDTYGDYNRTATRLQFVTILSNALPESVFEQKNQVVDNAIPDVKATDAGAAEVYRFYRAGILTGSDTKGTFAPGSSIRRSETAAIITRMVKPELRKNVTLAGPDPEVQKALELGIVPEQIQGDYEKQITYAEFAAILGRMTAVVAPERKADWEKISEPFRNAQEPMTRGAGAVVLFDCAMAMKIGGEGFETAILGIGGTSDMPQDDPLLPNLQDKYVSEPV